MSMLARNWKDLDGLENENYKIEVDLDMGCGWIRAKSPDKRDLYLSTHTFYESSYLGYAELLQSRGFDVELFSWGN